MLEKFLNDKQYKMDRSLIALSIFFILAIIVILLLGIQVKHYTAGMRGFIAEQGIWAKHQKESVVELTQYTRTGRGRYFARYQYHLKFIKSAIAARKELDRPDPDWAKAYQKLMLNEKRSGINERNMAAIYNCLITRDTPIKAMLGSRPFGKAFQERQKTEKYFTKLESLADQIHQAISQGQLSETRENSMVLKIYKLDQKMTIHEKRFTYLMDKAASHLENDFFDILAFVGVLVAVFVIGAIGKLFFDMKRWKRSVVSSSNQFRLLYENTDEGILLITPSGDIKAANKAATRLFGLPEETLTSKHWKDLLTSSKESLPNKSKKEATYKFRKASGKSFSGQVLTSSFEGQEGKQQIYLIIRDVTEQEQYLKQIEENEQGYHDLMNSLHDGIFIQNKDGRYLEINEAGAQMYGLEKDQLIGKRPKEALPGLKGRLREIHPYFNAACNGESQVVEFQCKADQCKFETTELKLVPGTYKGQKVVIGVARDITERKKAEQEIKQNEQLYSQLFLNAPVGIIYNEYASGTIKINRSFETMFGYSQQDIERIDIFDALVPTDLKEEARQIRAAVQQGQTQQMETVRKKKNGSLLSVKMALIPVEANQKIIGTYALFVDISDRKLAEERKILLSEIHHRVKNNMAVISGMLQLQAFNTEDENLRDLLNDSQLRIQSMASIHELLYQSDQLTDIDFRPYLDKLLANIKKTLHTNIREEIYLDLQIPDVSLNINQAIPAALLLNELITNAFKHAFNGLDQQEKRINIAVTQEDNIIEMIVSDNGSGLPADLKDIKADSLGMTLVDTLINQLEADLTVDSNKGTTFKIRFTKDELAKGSASAL